MSEFFCAENRAVEFQVGELCNELFCAENRAVEFRVGELCNELFVAILGRLVDSLLNRAVEFFKGYTYTALLSGDPQKKQDG